MQPLPDAPSMEWMPAFQDDRAVPTIVGAAHPAADIVAADDARRGARRAAVSDDGARRPPGGVSPPAPGRVGPSLT